MTAPLRVLIVDDEQPARDLLREYLEELPQAQVVGECSNGFEAVKAVSTLEPDLVLLDIQMPKLNGFEVLELLDHRPAVIFTTAYDEFALRAFEFHAVDYLLKPFAPDRLKEALERAAVRRNQGTVGAPPDELARSARAPGQPLDRVLVRHGSEITVLPVDRIDYLEARDDHVCLHADGQEHLKPARLGKLEEELDPRCFVRVHRSFLLNVERLAKVELYAKDSRVAILHDGRKIPVSRSGYQRLRAFLD